MFQAGTVRIFPRTDSRNCEMQCTYSAHCDEDCHSICDLNCATGYTRQYQENKMECCQCKASKSCYKPYQVMLVTLNNISTTK